MAKKFNKEERKAILAKTKQVMQERHKTIWNEKIKNYVPSKAYLKAQNLMEQHNSIYNELNKYSEMRDYWYRGFDIKEKLELIRDNEIRKDVPEYIFNETMLDCELILMNQEEPIDQIIETLINKCFQ